MFPLNSNDQYIDSNGKRHTLGVILEGSEQDIEELEETVAGHTTQIGALQNNINPDEYSATTSYTAGDYVIHDNVLYKCNTSCTADTWANNSQYFTSTNVADELTAINSDLIVESNYYTTDNQGQTYIGSKVGYLLIGFAVRNSNLTSVTILMSVSNDEMGYIAKITNLDGTPHVGVDVCTAIWKRA